MRRAVSALFLCAILALMGACEGTGRVVIRTPIGYLELEYEPSPLLDGTACGSVEIERRLYTIYCDDSGEPIYISPEDAPDRRQQVAPTSVLGTPLPQSAVVFDIDGVPYAMMRLPDTLLDIDLQGTAAALLAEHEVTTDEDEHDLPVSWRQAAGNGLDVRIALSSSLPLPNPFFFDLHQETIVVADTEGGPAFMLHRVVGAASEVARYARVAGLIDLAPTPALSVGPVHDLTVEAP